MQKVWNITDDPRSSLTPTTMFVFGVSLRPGAAVAVEDEALKGAHKVRDQVSKGYLYVGKTPPKGYMAAKSPARAVVPEGHVRSHGPATGTVETKSVAKVVEAKKEEVEKVVEGVKESEETSYSFSKKKKKKDDK